MKSFNKYSVVILILSIAFQLQLSFAATWYTTYDGSRYLIEGSARYNWLQAMDECSRRGLQLVVIDNASKNTALVALLRSVFGSSRDLWIGHHDEFNTAKDKNRAWYSSSSGERIFYSYWDNGEPNNKNGEHCTEIYRKADFKWNDEDCDTHYFGYICEEHHLSVKCRKDIEDIKQDAQQKYLELAVAFNETQHKIQQNLFVARNETDNLLESWQRSSEDIFENFKESLKEIIRKQPYLEAVVADIGTAVNQMALEAKDELAKLTADIRQSIQVIQLNAENSVN
ncbi:uncharacterized protein [Musca autumnalis]|uniref:uncharacterized protein n=1 Tax=Musca autumnalis TaxID=221902 RepID=UPI003CF8CAED